MGRSCHSSSCSDVRCVGASAASGRPLRRGVAGRDEGKRCIALVSRCKERRARLTLSNCSARTTAIVFPCIPTVRDGVSRRSEPSAGGVLARLLRRRGGLCGGEEGRSESSLLCTLSLITCLKFATATESLASTDAALVALRGGVLGRASGVSRVAINSRALASRASRSVARTPRDDADAAGLDAPLALRASCSEPTLGVPSGGSVSS